MARADNIKDMSRKSPNSPFGHETLDPSDKQNRVQDIFSSVSRNYDNTKPIISNNLRAYFHCQKRERLCEIAHKKQQKDQQRKTLMSFNIMMSK